MIAAKGISAIEKVSSSANQKININHKITEMNMPFPLTLQKLIRPRLWLTPMFLCALLLFTATETSYAQEKNEENYRYPAKLYEAMKWRNIGPFRGGRVTAVSGLIGSPDMYYMGATGGGVWKTLDGLVPCQRLRKLVSGI